MSESPSEFIPEVGKVYHLRHTRFGRATVKVTDDLSQGWVTVEILKGWLVGMREQWGPGTRKTVRLVHCYWTPVEETGHA